MKKIIFISALLISVFSFTACASSKKLEAKNSTEASSNEKKTNKKNRKKEAKASKKSDNNIIEASTKDLTHKEGIVQVKVKPKMGTYNIAVADENEKLVQVLSAANEYTTTNLFLKVDKKVYGLAAAPNVKCTVSKKDNVVFINYEINKVADVVLAMDFIQSTPERDIDMVKCTISVKNTGKKKAAFTVKEVLDTILGEKTDSHFYTFDNQPVKTEVLYRSLKLQKWFTSRNESTSMQLLFDGGDTSAPELFVLANYSTLASSYWEPDMATIRSFNTVLSYNNSAVGVIWPSVNLLSEQTADFVYYLAFATDGAKPCGDQYVYGMPSEKKNNTTESVSIKKEEEPKDTVINISEGLISSDKTPETKAEIVNTDSNSTYNKDEVAGNETQTNVYNDEVTNSYNDDAANESEEVVKKKFEENYTPKATESVEFNVKKLSREKFTPEYIQKLLDRIAELEKDSASVNRDELLKLNQELDQILEALRE